MAREQEDFAELVRRYAPLVHARCRRALGSADADDAAQAVFLVLARRAAAAPAGPRLAAWLLGVADHVVRNALRSRARRARAEAAAAAVAAAPQQEEAGMEELRSHLDAALAELPAAEREALRLHHLAGHTLAEVGEATGVPLRTAHARIQRGLERLRGILGRRGGAVGAAALLACLQAEASAAIPSELLAKLLAAPGPRALAWAAPGRSPLLLPAMAGLALLLVLAADLWLARAVRIPEGADRPRGAVATAARPAEADLDAQLEARQTRLVAGFNAFACELHRQVAKEGGNQVVSPFSAAQLFALLRPALDAPVRSALERSLGWDGLGAGLDPALLRLRREVLGMRGVGFDSRLLLFHQEGWKPAPAWTDLLRIWEQREPIPLDFTKPQEAADQVHGWLGRGMRLPSGVLQPETRLLALDRSSLAGRWQVRFQWVHDSTFRSATGAEIPCQMMHFGSLVWLRGFREPGLAVVELPFTHQPWKDETGFRGEETDCTVLLAVPDAGDGLPALEARLDQIVLADWHRRLALRPAEVAMPRFLLEAEHDLLAGQPELARADLGAGLEPPQHPCLLSAARQRARIRVDEFGCEAEAISDGGGVGCREDDLLVVTADRPFLFLIRHRRSGALLFTARVAAPAYDRPLPREDDPAPAPTAPKKKRGK